MCGLNEQLARFSEGLEDAANQMFEGLKKNNNKTGSGERRGF